MSIQELRNKRANAWEAAKAFLDTHRQENGMIAPEDVVTYNRMEADIVNLGKEIERLEHLDSLDREMRRPLSAPLTGKPGISGSAAGRASKEYRDAMLAAMRTNFRQISDVLQEGTDAGGGYLVPAEWDSRLIDTLSEENILRKLGTTITTSGQHKINIAATKPAASWIEEGGALSFGDATFDQIVLDAHKLHVAVKVTEELLYDNAFNLESYLIDQFGRALGNAEEEAFLNGDGAGKPTGIFDVNGGGEAKIVAAGSGISADDIINLVYALKRPYRKNAKFIMNDATISMIRKLKDNNGQYLWQPALAQGEPDRLLGYELYTSAYAPLFKAGGPVMAFGDFSYYNIGDRGTRSFQELRELFAGNGMIGMLAKERVDGKLVLPEAVQILTAKAAG